MLGAPRRNAVAAADPRTPPSPPEQRAAPRAPAASSFVPGLVHELRNFLFGLSGSLDAFGVRFAELEGAEPYLRTMRASLARLYAFLDELADYGDPRSGPWADLDLERLLRAAAALQGARQAHPERLRLDIRAPLPPVPGDPESLAAAFGHLLALALGDPAGTAPVRVEVRAAGGPGTCRVEGAVLGDVPGRPGVDPARLFEPFYYRAAGFGRLALPVARRVLERHGGSLAAAPAAGGGIRLAFRLPAH
jgi:signal transduction histidine kinase